MPLDDVIFYVTIYRYGNIYPDGLCSAGYYCPGGDNTTKPDDTICPQGKFPPTISLYTTLMGAPYESITHSFIVQCIIINLSPYMEYQPCDNNHSVTTCDIEIFKDRCLNCCSSPPRATKWQSHIFGSHVPYWFTYTAYIKNIDTLNIYTYGYPCTTYTLQWININFQVMLTFIYIYIYTYT